MEDLKCSLCEFALQENENVLEHDNGGLCGACGRLRYCSKDCQRVDWPSHKAQCKKWRDELIISRGLCPLGDVANQEKQISNVRNHSTEKIVYDAENGNYAAQYVLGACYYSGDRLKIDYTQAAKWYELAANANVARAQMQLGCMYERGLGGLESNPAESVRLCVLAAAQGLAVAQYNLASCFYRGNGVPQDRQKACYFWTLAAEQNYSDAQGFLAQCFIEGTGVHVDYSKALEWAIRCEAQNNKLGQYLMGRIYRRGLGVTADMKIACSFFFKAAKQDFKLAKDTLHEISMTPEFDDDYLKAYSEFVDLPEEEVREMWKEAKRLAAAQII